MYRALYLDFLAQDEETILGELLAHAAGDVELTQRNAWQAQVAALKSLDLPLPTSASAIIYFELTVPRLGRRVDVVIIAAHALFVIEFKVGESTFHQSAYEQVWDYALDFKYFHDQSHDLYIVPVLIATEAPDQAVRVTFSEIDDSLAQPVPANASQLSRVIVLALDSRAAPAISSANWESGRYLPTPTIIEAARALYSGHAVEEISRSDAGAKNLVATSKSIDAIIERTKSGRRKSICFVTGVPGAGKTLVGLDIANRHLDPQSATYSVFLSGNGPLVSVLREALARDHVERSILKGARVGKGEARKKIEAFIQNVHHFRDEYLRDPGAPPEHVVLFDEAQRAWNAAQTSAFMTRKRQKEEFDYSEPEFLISCLDRHSDWAVVVCLVGSGQEINTGEAGVSEWVQAVVTKFDKWDLYLPTRLMDNEYKSQEVLASALSRRNTWVNEDLHLSVSMRSFRAESLSRFVRELLDCDETSARRTLGEISRRYPIVLTRSLATAKTWLRKHARGSERYGIIVSSQAERLKPHAIDVRVKTDPVRWFLDSRNDTRSSFYLEDVATEFQVQGLELDWACVVWDGDLRFNGGGWAHHEFRGSRWIGIKKKERKNYLENAYRVLLTRARQGMIVVVPEGDESDPTRMRDIYDPTYDYLRSIGLPDLRI